MAYNNGFPMGYQPYYTPQYNSMYPTQVSGAQNAQQLMTPPTIHAEIVQIGGEDEALSFPVGAGQSQMMMSKDDSAIFIKTAYSNGQSTLVKYAREQTRQRSSADSDFITRDEFESRLAEIMKTSGKVEEDE